MSCLLRTISLKSRHLLVSITLKQVLRSNYTPSNTKNIKTDCHEEKSKVWKHRLEENAEKIFLNQ